MDFMQAIVERALVWLGIGAFVQIGEYRSFSLFEVLLGLFIVLGAVRHEP